MKEILEIFREMVGPDATTTITDATGAPTVWYRAEKVDRFVERVDAELTLAQADAAGEEITRNNDNHNEPRQLIVDALWHVLVYRPDRQDDFRRRSTTLPYPETRRELAQRIPEDWIERLFPKRRGGQTGQGRHVVHDEITLAELDHDVELGKYPSRNAAIEDYIERGAFGGDDPDSTRRRIYRLIEAKNKASKSPPSLEEAMASETD